MRLIHLKTEHNTADIHPSSLPTIKALYYDSRYWHRDHGEHNHSYIGV
jgi:hypothetical protein